jgi:hypothetical protein
VPCALHVPLPPVRLLTQSGAAAPVVTDLFCYLAGACTFDCPRFPQCPSGSCKGNPRYTCVEACGVQEVYDDGSRSVTGCRADYFNTITGFPAAACKPRISPMSPDTTSAVLETLFSLERSDVTDEV